MAVFIESQLQTWKPFEMVKIRNIESKKSGLREKIVSINTFVENWLKVFIQKITCFGYAQYEKNLDLFSANKLFGQRFSLEKSAHSQRFRQFFRYTWHTKNSSIKTFSILVKSLWAMYILHLNCKGVPFDKKTTEVTENRI